LANHRFLKEEDMTFRRIVTATLALAIATLVVSGSSFAAPAKAAPAGKVNLNTATVEQLTTVPGVGPKLAARIVEQRQKSGSFKSVQEIVSVKGIGEKNLVKLQTYLTVGESAHPAASR
jgi:competence protein ComEA